jgi:hypothetical protein
MKHLNLWAALGAVFYLTSLAIAQEAGGMFSGRVVDPTGAGVPGAEVVAVHTATGVTYKARSSSDGGYALPNLRIGAYDLSVTKAGFRRTIRKGIELHVSEHLGVELPLQIGELAQEVSVTANVEQVQTESSAQGGLITGDQVRELQMNGRGFTTLLELLPGVASDNPDRNDPIAPTLSMSVNGARTSSIGFGVDGSSTPGVVGSNAMYSSTSPESIAEFTVLTSTFSAEYGRGGITQVNVVTKSGTRHLHGSVYEFLRNDAFDAKDFFSHQVLPLKLNNFGYTIGGPVILPRYNRDVLLRYPGVEPRQQPPLGHQHDGPVGGGAHRRLQRDERHAPRPDDQYPVSAESYSFLAPERQCSQVAGAVPTPELPGSRHDQLHVGVAELAALPAGPVPRGSQLLAVPKGLRALHPGAVLHPQSLRRRPRDRDQ